MATAAADRWTYDHCCDRHPSARWATCWARSHLWLALCTRCTHVHTDALVMSGWVCERKREG